MYERDRYLMIYKSTSSSLIYQHLQAFQPSFKDIRALSLLL